MELNSELDKLSKYIPIEIELNKAIKKHPVYPSDMFQQVAIMMEEAGETVKAVLHYHYENGSILYVKKELIETAAMCIRMLNYLEEQEKKPVKK